MASSFAKSLLASVVAFVVGATAIAQDDFQEGVKLLRLGQSEEALKKFQDVIAKDPSNADALQLYQSISQDEWFLLLSQQGQIQQIAQSILERAKLEKNTQSRDEAAIETLVETACSDAPYAERRKATLTLIADHGEFAVPALAKRLGNADSEGCQVNSIATLTQIGPSAVLPLIELLGSSNAQLRLNAASALYHIGDPRAAAAMARLAERDDHQNVQEVARKFLTKLNVKGRAVDLYLQDARNYLRGSIAPGAFSSVIWTLEDDKLVAKDVPALVYPIELAKACAADAVKADPSSAEARSMLAQANLAEANLIQGSLAQGDEGVKALEPMVPEFELAALAAGPKVLRQALDEGLKYGLVNVSLGAIDALAKVESRDDLAQSTLVAALDSTDKRVRYAAAVALVKASRGVNVPASDRVVDALAQAVTEESVRMIQLIGNSPEFANAAKEASIARGTMTAVADSAVGGMRRILDTPDVDVVVIQNVLPDRLPQDVIGNIKRDNRLGNVKVLIVAKDVEQAKTEFGDSIAGVIQGPLTGQALLEAVNAALADVPVESRNVRAENYAQHASEALQAMAVGKTPIDGALASLAAQLDRGDAVSVPAARALGLSGRPEQLDSLLAAVTGSGSTELKVAAANAMGMILGRANACPQQICEGLLGVLKSDAEVAIRSAAAAALGKATLDDAMRAQVMESLQKIGSTPPAAG